MRNIGRQIATAAGYVLGFIAIYAIAYPSLLAVMWVVSLGDGVSNAQGALASMLAFGMSIAVCVWEYRRGKQPRTVTRATLPLGAVPPKGGPGKGTSERSDPHRLPRNNRDVRPPCAPAAAPRGAHMEAIAVKKTGRKIGRAIGSVLGFFALYLVSYPSILAVMWLFSPLDGVSTEQNLLASVLALGICCGVAAWDLRRVGRQEDGSDDNTLHS